MRERLAISASSKVAVGQTSSPCNVKLGTMQNEGAFKQEPSILSAAIEDAMKGAVPLAFAIQQSAECPLRVKSRKAPLEHLLSKESLKADFAKSFPQVGFVPSRHRGGLALSGRVK